MPNAKNACWRSKESFLQCIAKTKCYQHSRSFEECLLVESCHLPRKNWVVCKMNAANPKYRNRGNPYDIMTDDQRKTDDRLDRLHKRIIEEDGVAEEGDEFKPE